MDRVSVTRTVDAPIEDVREAMTDVEAFMEGAGFDEVEHTGDTLRLGNRVGLFDIELVLDIVDDPDATLAYEQRDGIFDWMWTEYHTGTTAGETTVTATTEYEALDLPVLGTVVDSTVVERQRRAELNAQFDWLVEQVA